MSCMDADRSIVSFVRTANDSKDQLLFVCNFTPVVYENFRQAVPGYGKYKEIFNSDAKEYGGTNLVNAKTIKAERWDCDGKDALLERP